MKIVFVIPDMPGGGTERVVALLANEYCRRGIEVAILLFAGHETAYPLDERIEIVSVGNPSGGRFAARIERLRRMRRYYAENKECQIWAFSVMGAVFSVIAAWGQKHFLLVSERNDPNKYDHKRIRNLAYRFADVVVCQTPDAVRQFPQGIGGRAAVIPNPVDVGGLQPYTGERDKRIVAVGRLEPQKNHKLLLCAFAGFVKNHAEYILEIYGKGELEEELKALSRTLGIEQNVRLRGFSGRVKEEINHAAMYVLSSDYEGISNSMLEAIALGVPVIATDCPIGGSGMYIEDGVNGLLVPVGETEPMTEAMNRIADDRQLSDSISAEGRKLKEKNKVEQIADRFLALSGVGSGSKESRVLVINPILYTSETNNIPRVKSIKDTMIYALCLGFLKEGHQVTLIAAEDYRPTVEEQYDFPILWMKTVCHSIFQPRCLPYMPELRRYLKKHTEYDYIISSEMFATWSYTAARVCPQKTVVWHELAKHNNMLHKIPSRVWYRMVAAVLMRKVNVVPRSKAAADFIGQFSHKVSDTIIDHGVDIEEMAPVRMEDKQNQFVVVSQLIERKQIDKTIDSFAAFRSEGHQDYKLYIIGGGEQEEMLKAQTRRLRIEDAVVFCGKLTHEELLPIVSRSKAMLVSTRKDNNMVSVVESIAVGTPVVTTSVPYNAYYIAKEKLGIVRDDWDKDTLEQLCGKYDVYYANCMAYRNRLSNVYCARQFMAVRERLAQE